MFAISQNAKQYWDERSELFGNYYLRPSLFDKIFRKGIFTRVAVALKTCRQLDRPVVLDIGSGPGINSVTFIKNSTAQKVVGIDFASKMIEYANQHAQKEGVEDKCQFVTGDFLDYDFGGISFDLSVALGVFDYIGDAQIFLKKMSDVSDKAYVVSWPENGLRMMLRRFRYDCPVYHYTKADLHRFHEYCRPSKLDIVKGRGGWVTVGWK
jgi:2-polyprenyl-3-methyl-5-hydroxy-6-metoxy-1,4-benzoquinol methylase